MNAIPCPPTPIAGPRARGDRPRARGRGRVRADAGAAPRDACTARSAATVPPVVELYTSEGCNSCPPADRWLSKLKADPSVVALAFHVDYWDRLGWKDRFASAAFTARQAEQQASNGARFSYTPQVVVDGQRPQGLAGHRRRRSARRPAAPVDVLLARDGDRVTATVAAARRRAEAARRLLGGHRAGPRHRRQGRREPGRDAAARLRGARLPDRCRPGRARSGAPQTLAFQLPARADAARIRARSTWSSSTPTAAGRCRR